MNNFFDEIKTLPLFEGIKFQDLEPMFRCIGYNIREYGKGEIITLTSEQVKWIGILLSGTVHMIKEDMWGNKAILAFIAKGQLFGETFACRKDVVSTVTFLSADTSKILFLPFHKVMTSCNHSCAFHHQLIENMVTLIAEKNYQLLEKVEVISKKTLRMKIMTFLNHEAHRCGSMHFKTPLGRVAMADYLGADRSALTRELCKMRDEGLINFDKNSFTLLR